MMPGVQGEMFISVFLCILDHPLHQHPRIPFLTMHRMRHQVIDIQRLPTKQHIQCPESCHRKCLCIITGKDKVKSIIDLADHHLAQLLRSTMRPQLNKHRYELFHIRNSCDFNFRLSQVTYLFIKFAQYKHTR